MKVLVGPSKKAYYIHRQKLTNSSRFFKAALTNNWHEGETNLVRLRETDLVIFDRYVQWLYHGTPRWLERLKTTYDRTHGSVEVTTAATGTVTLWDVKEQPLSTGGDFEPTWADEARLLVTAYFLGDMLQCPGFRNAIIDALTAISQLGQQLTAPNLFVEMVMDRPTLSKKLRHLMLDVFISSHRGERMVNPFSCVRWAELDLPIDMLHICAERMFEAGTVDSITTMTTEDLCRRYHDHESGARRCGSLPVGLPRWMLARDTSQT